MSITRLQIKSDVLSFLGPRFDAMMKRFTGQPLVTTTIGSTTTLIDTALGRSTRADSDYNQRQIEIVETVASGPADGEAAGVTNGGFNTSTNTLTLNPALSAAIQTGTDYLLYPANLSPESLNGDIKRMLHSTWGRGLYFPSLIDDADFELNTSTASVYWADAVGTPTQTFESSSAELVLFGERSLKIVTTNSGDGVHNSDTVAATAGEVLELLTSVRCTAGSVTVQVYDVTNSAVIETVTVDENAWATVRLTATVPSGCEEVRVRYLSATATSTIYVAAGVSLQSQNPRYYLPPTYLTGEHQILDAFRLPLGMSSVQADSYITMSGGIRAAERVDTLRWDRGLTPMLVGTCGAGSGMYGMEVYRPFAEISTNSSTTNIDREYAKWRVIANILESHGEDEWPIYDRKARQFAALLGYGKHELVGRDNAMVLV